MGNISKIEEEMKSFQEKYEALMKDIESSKAPLIR